VSGEPVLSRRLVLEAREAVADGSGGFAVTWVPLGTLWADVAARAGREDFVGGQARPRVKVRILVRGAPAGSPSRPRAEQRFREGDRIFDILTVAEGDARGRFLEIVAEEGVLS
jgi:SPP1 family predicted phage head-tail adaptor